MEITIKDVMAFFGMQAAEFAREWKQCSATDKQQIKAGIADGSLTY